MKRKFLTSNKRKKNMEHDLQKDIIYTRIKEMIVNGTFAMGEKISERTLEQSLKANKAPIRDA